MDFGYFIQAESDAYSIVGDQAADERGWEYGCDYQVLYKFEYPITLGDVRRDPYMDEWGAFRANFQRKAYRIPENVWSHVVARMEQNDPGFARFLESGAVKKATAKILREEELENLLAEDIGTLQEFGFDLEVRERQLTCVGHGGRIDLLCYESKRKHYVVIELKNVRAGQNTFGQIATYLGWVQKNVSKGKPAYGLVVARGFDNRFLAAAATNERVSYIDVKQLGFE